MRKVSFVFAIFLLLPGLLTNPAAAQNDSLSKDPAQFFTRVSSILLNTKSPAYQAKAQALLLRFGGQWNNKGFSKNEKQQVQETVEKMRTKKLHTFPYLYQYLWGITLLAENHRSDNEFTAWNRYLSETIDPRRMRNFLNFIRFTENLLEKHLLYNKSSATWHFNRAEFTLHYDSVFSVHFQHLNLIKASRNDSIMIMQTHGIFTYPARQWEGTGGRLQWNRFPNGMNAQYRIISQYHFNLKSNLYHIDSVTLTSPEFLGKQKIIGRISDRVLTGKPGKNSIYPQFVSYENNIFLPNIYPHVSFRGGIEREGKKMYGIEIKGHKPEVIFNRKQKPVLTVRSKRFEFDKNKLLSADVDARLLLDNDSIYHPRLIMRYDVPSKTLQLYTLSDRQIPFFDSYHKMDIYVPALVWHISADSLLFKKLRGVNDKQPARFESDRYFNLRQFYEVQGIDDMNPLYVVNNFTKAFSTRIISVNALAGYMNKPPEQIENLLMRLSNRGFVIYDADTKKAVATPRLKYFLNAKAGRTDYDVIHFYSKEKLKPNASLNLKDYSLDIYGVPRVFISDSQKVYIYPADKKIALRKSRNFTFTGKVSAGLFNFYARKSTFVYDSFMINLNYVDSLSFGVWEKDTLRNRRYVVPVKQTLQKLSGRLYIDLPFNKAGLLHAPKYPEFISESVGYVYYNSRHIQDSTLLPGKFYYRVSPFVFDSIMTFNTDGLAFQGSLVSDSIFSPISQPLRVMPDHSLGFVYRTPPEGITAYGGKARFYDTLTLNMKGFHGSGKLHYLTTSVKGKDFVFYPDSLLAQKATHFFGKSDAVKYHFPKVYGDTVHLKWNTKVNRMQIATTRNPFTLYSDATLEGNITLSPEDFTGTGHFAFGHSDLSSKHFLFTDRGLNADSANFILKNAQTGDTTFLAKNYRAHIDFKMQKGWFNHLNQNSFLTFPFNRYICTLDEVEWLMDQDKLSLYSTHRKTSSNFDSLTRKQQIAWHQPGPEFISVDPAADSLRFYAQKAFYNISQYSIDAEGVRLIKTGDAAVFPGNQAVTILQKGKLAPLENATILVDTANLYHTIYEAEVQIHSRKSYTASGKLDYKDMNGTVQPIQMTKVFTDSSGQSEAIGKIPKGEIFFLSPEYFFTGTVIMHARDPLLHFRGGYQLNEDCVDNTGNWMAVDQDLDPQHIAFRFTDTSKTADSLKAWFGLAYSFQYHHYYPLVLQALRNPSDQVLISATGNLTIDHKTGRFMMGSPDRFKNHNVKDNFVALNTKNCQLEGDGIFNLGMKNHMLKTRFIGQFKHNVVRDSTILHVVMMMKFYFDENALNLMADSLRMIPSHPVNITKGLYPMALDKLLGPDKAKNILTELSLYGQTKKLPPALQNTISLNDVTLIWDPLTRSFISKGPIGIGNIGNNTLNKYMNGIIQIKKNRSGTSIEMILRHGKRQWYYFNYANGIMQVLSSDIQFNDIIDNLKEDKRVLHPNSDTDYYEYVLTTRTRVVNFLRAMKRAGRLK